MLEKPNFATFALLDMPDDAKIGKFVQALQAVDTVLGRVSLVGGLLRHPTSATSRQVDPTYDPTVRRCFYEQGITSASRRRRRILN